MLIVDFLGNKYLVEISRCYVNSWRTLSMQNKTRVHQFFNRQQKTIRANYSGHKSVKTPYSRQGLATPFDSLQLETGGAPHFSLWKPCLFTLTFSIGGYFGASVWEYENIRSKAVRAANGASSFAWFKNRLSQKKTKDWRKEVDTWWKNLTPGEKIFAPICLANSMVFILWRIPRIQPYMLRYFCSNPAARVVCWPMILSTFSHYSLFHILANMYVLHSFSNAAVSALGKEQFLGFYLSAGVVSTLASYVYKTCTKLCGPSLGASGAIMGILAYVCIEYPDTQLSILFLPNWTFSAGSAIKAIMGIDLAGCLLGWKFFDHAAHLGGATFGLFWWYFGSQVLWPKREYFMQYWHQLRTSK